MDLIAYGSINKNYIDPSFDLTETFQGYIALLPQMNRQASMAYPFYYLQSDGFWNLQPRPDTDVKPGTTISSLKRLRECYYGAKLNDDLLPLLQMQTSREKLRAVLIGTYFSEAIQPRLWEQSVLNHESANYSTSLLITADSQPPTVSAEKPAVSPDKVRDYGFRKAITRLYDHRCALCGIKIITPEDHTIVDAAHIIPWSKSHDDRPTNGMALCKLCHWSFDEGLMAVGSEYQVIVSSTVKIDPNLPGHMLTLSDRPIFKPVESRFWPALDNFQWHRKKRFKQTG
jgi:putative restriction endonuclease